MTAHLPEQLINVLPDALRLGLRVGDERIPSTPRFALRLRLHQAFYHGRRAPRHVFESIEKMTTGLLSFFGSQEQSQRKARRSTY